MSSSTWEERIAPESASVRRVARKARTLAIHGVVLRGSSEAEKNRLGVGWPGPPLRSHRYVPPESGAIAICRLVHSSQAEFKAGCALSVAGTAREVRTRRPSLRAAGGRIVGISQVTTRELTKPRQGVV